MRLSEIFRLVWLNLSQNKFKVILTSIGIVAGSATIMLVIAIGTGGKEEIAEQFKNLNAGAIDISYEGGAMAGFSINGSSGGRGSSSGSMPDMSAMGEMMRGMGGPGGMSDFGGGAPDMGSIGGGSFPGMGSMAEGACRISAAVTCRLLAVWAALAACLVISLAVWAMAATIE